jgi:hypothetical protein
VHSEANPVGQTKQENGQQRSKLPCGGPKKNKTRNWSRMKEGSEEGNFERQKRKAKERNRSPRSSRVARYRAQAQNQQQDKGKVPIRMLCKSQTLNNGEDRHQTETGTSNVVGKKVMYSALHIASVAYAQPKV